MGQELAAIVHDFREQRLLRRDSSLNNEMQQPSGDDAQVPMIQGRICIGGRHGLGSWTLPQIGSGNPATPLSFTALDWDGINHH